MNELHDYSDNYGLSVDDFEGEDRAFAEKVLALKDGESTSIEFVEMDGTPALEADGTPVTAEILKSTALVLLHSMKTSGMSLQELIESSVRSKTDDYDQEQYTYGMVLEDFENFDDENKFYAEHILSMREDDIFKIKFVDKNGEIVLDNDGKVIHSEIDRDTALAFLHKMKTSGMSFTDVVRGFTEEAKDTEEEETPF